MALPAGTHARAIDIPGAARPELLSLARGRPLLIDWFKASRYCCGRYVGFGDVSLRWIDPETPLEEDDWVRLDDVEPLEVYAQRDIVALLARAGARLEVGGIGPFRKPTVVISDGNPWIDFFDTCPPRSALRH